jgi:GNAT superfamily N-acetyltransferase
MSEVRFHRVGVEGEALLSSIDEAFESAEEHRGGRALIEQLAARDVTEFCRELSSTGGVWAAYIGDEVVGWALIQDRVILTMFVRPENRRQGVGSKFVKHLLESDLPPIDAFALPGDRAMKSLYESIGWKARLLTMRG